MHAYATCNHAARAAGCGLPVGPHPNDACAQAERFAKIIFHLITSETQQYTMKRLAAMITLLCYYYTQLLKIHHKISSTVVEQ